MRGPDGEANTISYTITTECMLPGDNNHSLHIVIACFPLCQLNIGLPILHTWCLDITMNTQLFVSDIQTLCRFGDVICTTSFAPRLYKLA